jgi:hypothetical protein
MMVCVYSSQDGLGLFITLESIHSMSHCLLSSLTEHQLQKEVQNFYVPNLNFLMLKERERERVCVRESVCVCVCVCVCERERE